MPNPLYSKLNGNQQGNMMQQFQRFMNQMQGENPNEIIEQIVASGQLSQQQLNSIQQQAKNMEQQFSAMRSMFGF
jgi:uncharacterized membrane protein (DUF106 family)